VTRRTYGILAGMIGTTLGAWYWSRHRTRAMRARHLTPARDHGELIFDNTPTAMGSDALGG
jgi:hypothetical protein